MTKRAKHPTLAEVAKRAGVGTTTVSRVINGGLNVDPRTLARVQRAIGALGYMPNQAARILKGARTRTIGLVIPSIADPFFASAADAVQAVVHAHDSVLMVLTTQNDPKTEFDAIGVLTRHRVDGLIIAPCNAEDDVLSSMLSRLSTPIVSLDRPIEGSAIPVVVANNREGARMATEHLAAHGLRRIVCFAKEMHLFTMQERMQGYRAAMRAAKLTARAEIVDDGGVSLEERIGQMLASPQAPEAIFTLKNSLTVEVFEVLQRLNVRIPERVALLGYDDFTLADVVRPSISVIAQPIEELGRVAAELLCDRLLGAGRGDTEVERWTQLSTRLIRRASCGCEAAGTTR